MEGGHSDESGTDFSEDSETPDEADDSADEADDWNVDVEDDSKDEWHHECPHEWQWDESRESRDEVKQKHVAILHAVLSRVFFSKRMARRMGPTIMGLQKNETSNLLLLGLAKLALTHLNDKGKCLIPGVCSLMLKPAKRRRLTYKQHVACNKVEVLFEKQKIENLNLQLEEQ